MLAALPTKTSKVHHSVVLTDAPLLRADATSDPLRSWCATRQDFEEYRRLVRVELGLSTSGFSAEGLKRVWKSIDEDGDSYITCGEL